MSIEPQAQANLLRLVKAWCAAKRINLNTAGRYIHSDPHFFTNIEDRVKSGARQEGDKTGSFNFRKYDELIEYFYNTANWPKRWVGGFRKCPHKKDPQNPDLCSLCGAQLLEWPANRIPRVKNLMHHKRRK